MSEKTGIIYGINGPVVYLKNPSEGNDTKAERADFKMSEMVYVGKERLVGEVIALSKDTTTVQVFEETSGIKPGELVYGTGDAISVTLGPGILDNIFYVLSLDAELEELSLDGSIVQEHQHSAGAKKGGRQTKLDTAAAEPAPKSTQL